MSTEDPNSLLNKKSSLRLLNRKHSTGRSLKAVKLFLEISKDNTETLKQVILLTFHGKAEIP